MACSSTCPTQDHESFGACLRSKNLHTAYMGGGADATAQKNADKTLAAYANARKHGIQPASTRKADVDAAIQISDKTGRAFQA
jgi:hypothetical protein